ncbi:hypothetical protein L0Z42_29500 [Burkholderia multivorans]|uniref:hypothetical protein n=1 Tax=Burkholderia cepacia complex TaxID=87882 RepID=UPI00018E370A|nr:MULTISPECIES: hypothetical protein [Burkholderia cepacia complex]EED97242.1 conserved hypothetical protein [Burkholderia multivorans CGD1]MBJ9624988.1 hypothetical protein [Burkholderia multivorans]MCO1374627.1 hypothetical protein [Burkholderia multivorans]MCO1459771.1 hypothetical protein [Burkholderia multivorans]PRF47180.1 hypothetical protein C6Q04_18805 [Burkholderia multivorans]
MGLAAHFERWFLTFAGCLTLLYAWPGLALASYGRISWNVFGQGFMAVFLASVLLALWKSWRATDQEIYGEAPSWSGSDREGSDPTSALINAKGEESANDKS